MSVCRDDARRDELLLRRYHRDRDPQMRDELVERYLPLARSVAQRFAGRAEPMDDLHQVAVIGLIKAVDRYDPSHRSAFSSYAVPTISGELKRHFRDRTWSVRPPRDLLERSLRVENAARRLLDTNQRQPTVAEIVAYLGDTDEELVLEAMQAGQAHSATSMQSQRGSDPEAATLEDTIGRDEDGFDHVVDRVTVGMLMRAVSDREREVLRLRFEEDLTQSEIGAILGVSQMQVSRIIRAALKRLRIAAEAAPARSAA